MLYPLEHQAVLLGVRQDDEVDTSREGIGELQYSPAQLFPKHMNGYVGDALVPTKPLRNLKRSLPLVSVQLPAVFPRIMSSRLPPYASSTTPA